MCTLIARNSRDMYIRTINSIQPVSVKEISLRKRFIEFTKQVLKCQRKYLWSSLDNSVNRYNFRIKTIEIHKFLSKYLTAHTKDKSHGFRNWEFAFANEVFFWISNEIRNIFLYFYDNWIQLVFDDFTIFLHDKVLLSDVYILLASPHIFSFLSIPFCENLYYIHKNSHRLLFFPVTIFSFLSLMTLVLKWAGGKTQLLGQLTSLMPNEEITTYCEPLWGGAML